MTLLSAQLNPSFWDYASDYNVVSSVAQTAAAFSLATAGFVFARHAWKHPEKYSSVWSRRAHTLLGVTAGLAGCALAWNGLSSVTDAFELKKYCGGLSAYNFQYNPKCFNNAQELEKACKRLDTLPNEPACLPNGIELLRRCKAANRESNDTFCYEYDFANMQYTYDRDTLYPVDNVSKFSADDPREKFLYLAANADHNSAVHPSLKCGESDVRYAMDVKYKTIGKVKDLCTQLKISFEEAGKPIKDLLLHVHGNSDVLDLGEEWITRKTSFPKGCFTPLAADARIHLYACNTGAKDSKGIAQHLSNKSGRVVHAPTFNVDNFSYSVPRRGCKTRLCSKRPGIEFRVNKRPVKDRTLSPQSTNPVSHFVKQFHRNFSKCL
jgi:hypothetical protein